MKVNYTDPAVAPSALCFHTGIEPGLTAKECEPSRVHHLRRDVTNGPLLCRQPLSACVWIPHRRVCEKMGERDLAAALGSQSGRRQSGGIKVKCRGCSDFGAGGDLKVPPAVESKLVDVDI